MIDGRDIFGETALRWKLPDEKSTNGTCNGLVPSDNNPLPEPVLTQFFVAIWTSLGHNELKGTGYPVGLWFVSLKVSLNIITLMPA